MIRLFQISVPFIVWSLVWAAWAFGYETSIRISGGDKANVFCIAPSCPPCPVCPVCPQMQCTYVYTEWGACVDGFQSRTVLWSTPEDCIGTPVLHQTCSTPDPSINEVENMSINYFPMGLGQVRVWKFQVKSSVGFQIHLSNMFQTETSNADMVVKYGSVPTAADLQAARKGQIVPGLYYRIGSLSFEYVEASGIQPGWYYIMVQETVGNPSRLRLNVADMSCNVTATCPPAREYSW